MKGYWRREQATREAITEDGWFLTGDLGRVDEDGFVYVVGRLKDMIIRGGLNVYPREVEEVLHQHPAVTKLPSSAYPTSGWAKRSARRSCSRRAAALAPAELRDWAKQRLAPYKCPRRIWVLDELPKGPTGKILKRAIRRLPSRRRRREPGGSTAPRLSLRELSHSFGPVRAVDGFSMEIGGGRDPRALRPQRRRQDDADQHARRDRRPRRKARS